ncbi:nicotinate (nicotinamide) nucleotide adenylyltransferase [Yasminevirus sp. GU-2018]|uniref:Nicotinate (Nicotinamide) nucleotide adenylyltransferase n=1 Tax=Yasminevirus sp. GU-2018 TaxID=2420051 RepID=A0A5K0UAF4_9VIRU|nr:nicotinate (nicotinamide) nucleotide adenylyltransferase [Yasminevirus sp. GU-2018]
MSGAVNILHMCCNVGVYIGSFDPFHKGHQRICEYVVDKNIVSCVYILPNNPCRSKPNRSSLTHRLNMIHNQLEGSTLTDKERERIHVCEEDANDVIERLLSNKNTKLSLILGSDRYFDCMDHNKAPLRKTSYSGKFDSYIIVQRTGLKDRRIKKEDYRKDVTFFGRPFVVLSDVPDQEISSTQVRDGIYNVNSVDGRDQQSCHGNVCEKTVSYIQTNHLYEVDRIKKVLGSQIDATLINDEDSLSGNSVYKVVLPSQIVKYVKIGYTYDMREVHNAFEWFKDVHTEYYDHNILVMDKARGYRLTDVLRDTAIKRTMQFAEFEVIGKAVGDYIKQFHKIKQFDTDPRTSITYWRLMGTKKSTYDVIEQFEKEPGHLRLVHGDLSPNNIFVDFDVSKPITKPSDVKVTLIDLDKFSQLINQGGFPSYDYHQFISGVEYVSQKGVNNYHLIKGFFEGYRDFRDVSQPHTHRLCKDYWSRS